MPQGTRFNPQILSAPFPHLQPAHLQHHPNQQQSPGSAGLPPPSFNHPSFIQNNQNSALNPFAHTNGSNGLAAGFSGGAGLGGGGTGLASQAAIMGFSHGARLEERDQARQALRRGSGANKGHVKSRIREVFKDNLAEEMQKLRELVEKYPYVSMDTEFPGIVARPMGQFNGRADYHYQTLRCNVDLLRVIQLGITLFSKDGELPPANYENGGVSFGTPYQNNFSPCPFTWQFNFKFSMKDDMYNQQSIEFLMETGLDMSMLEINGIEPYEFGAQLICSGLVLDEDVRWISFHSGYDFAYLVKLMHCQPLPDDEAEYRKLLSLYFPSIYDIKYMMKSAHRMLATTNNPPLSANAPSILTNLVSKSGLQDLADELGVKRVGTAHQAGSDSLLTGKLFWEVKKSIFNGALDDEKFLGQVWGLNGVGGTSTTGTSGIEGQSTPNLNGATIYTTTGTPSTPNTTLSALSHTPSQPNQANGGGMGSMTPGEGVGVFGRFRYK